MLLWLCALGVTVLSENSAVFAQVKVGDNPETIHAGSVLEMESTNKGLLLPRVSLTSTTSWGLAGSAVAGMQIFNSNTSIISASLLYPAAPGGIGVYYWDGSGWVSSKQSQSSSGGDFDWLKVSNNASPSDPADIGSAIYHGGNGNQEVTVRSNTFAPNAFAHMTAIAGQGTAQPVVTNLFAEFNSSVNPEGLAEDNAVTGIQTTSEHPLIFRTTGSNDITTERMRITPEGGVGIGTPTMFGFEQASLRVNGPIIQMNADLLLASTQAVELRNGGIKIRDANGSDGTNGYIDFSDSESGGYDARIYFNNTIGQAGALVFRVVPGSNKDAITILKNDGYVGINKMNPNYQLDVSGDINATGEVRNSGIILTSDARLKRDIHSFQNGLSIVSKLNPVSYKKKSSIADSVYNRSEIGFIAQEVQKILPALVRVGKDVDKTLALDYNSLIPILTRAIQEQQKQIETLQAQRDGQSAVLSSQSSKLDMQTARLDAQSAELEEIRMLLKANVKVHNLTVFR